MKKTIRNLLVSIMIIFIIIGCFDKKEETKQFDNIADYMLMNMLQMKEFDIPPYYCLKDINGKQCRVDSILKKAELIFRFSEVNCDNCIESCINQMNELGINDNIIGLATYNNIRMLRYVKTKYDIQFPVYFLPFIDQNLLSDSKEKSGYPYFFLLDMDFRSRYLFSPSRQYLEISKEYLNRISKMLREKEDNHFDIFKSMNKDLGTISKGQKYKVDFEYFNKTTDLLIINDVKSSCGCVITKWNKEPLLPQKSAKLIVDFMPDNLGYTSKTVMVSHNKSNHPVRLIIRANVVE